ncbi:MAG: BMP family protein [Anaerolineae bacterium]|uniref:BMP family protein n=1 Tax=Candidatus Flexifilum breve TaxID=3140694 RepID=UPI001AC17A4A|nr:BMP family protein [Chloroflexota bacterium]MBK9747731.1 BMP family protein [Chloroflexota bacterium]MBN8637601.1 BMP family protein [Anaerolineae bacterium]
MGKKLSIVLLLVLLVLTFMLGGTASAGPAAQDATEEATSEAPLLKVAMILPGPINDNDWNMVGYNGLMAAAEELNLEVAYVENVTDADAERVLRDFATRGYDLIFAHSFSFGDAALSVAEDFPETYFMAGTARELADNLGTYSNPDYQGAYLAGMLAAGISESGVIGWVGGMPAPNMLANLHAYEAGAAEVNPDIEVLFTFIGSWFDPPKAKEAALAQVEQGADVLSAQGVGVIDAANEAGVYALGAMTDQNFLGEESVVTSVTWNLGPLVTGVAEEVIAGEWESRNWSFGLIEGSIELASYHDLAEVVTPELQDLIDAKIEAILSGDFVVEEDTTPVE